MAISTAAVIDAAAGTVPAPRADQARVEHLVLRSARSLEGVEQWTQLRRLTMEGCAVPNLDPVARLGEIAQLDILATSVDAFARGHLRLQRFTACGTNPWSPRDLASSIKANELVLRAVPWLNEDFEHFAGTAVVLSSEGMRAATAGSWRRYHLCTEELPNREWLVVRPGAATAYEAAVLRIPYGKGMVIPERVNAHEPRANRYL